MRLPFPAFLVAALLPPLLLGIWIAFGPAQPLIHGFSVLLYVLSSLIVFIDLLDLIARVWIQQRHIPAAAGGALPTSIPLDVGTFTPYQMRLHMRPYALLASVHNGAEGLDEFLEAIVPHRDRLWVIDDASTDDTSFRLQRAGIRSIRASRNRKKPGAIKELLALLPPEIATAAVLDPDIRILDRGDQRISDLERVIFDFQRSGRAAVCPRITVRPDGWLARLQAFEYAMGFRLGRKSLADYSVTSGVAIYRRDALEKALEEHTLSVYAEDLRNALILLGRGEAVYYDERLVIETEGKRTWGSWFSQRVGWYYGLLKVYAENFRDLRRGARGRPFFIYQYFVYLGCFALLLQPLRLLSLGLLTASTVNGLDVLLGLNWIPDLPATEPAYFLFAYAKYTALALLASYLVASGWREWLTFLPTVPIYFFYALVHQIPITVGYSNWLSLRLWGRRIYRDHYQDEESLRTDRSGNNG